MQVIRKITLSVAGSLLLALPLAATGKLAMVANLAEGDARSRMFLESLQAVLRTELRSAGFSSVMRPDQFRTILTGKAADVWQNAMREGDNEPLPELLGAKDWRALSDASGVRYFAWMRSRSGSRNVVTLFSIVDSQTGEFLRFSVVTGSGPAGLNAVDIIRFRTAQALLQSGVRSMPVAALPEGARLALISDLPAREKNLLLLAAMRAGCQVSGTGSNEFREEPSLHLLADFDQFRESRPGNAWYKLPEAGLYESDRAVLLPFLDNTSRSKQYEQALNHTEKLLSGDFQRQASEPLSGFPAFAADYVLFLASEGQEPFIALLSVKTRDILYLERGFRPARGDAGLKDYTDIFNKLKNPDLPKLDFYHSEDL